VITKSLEQHETEIEKPNEKLVEKNIDKIPLVDQQIDPLSISEKPTENVTAIPEQSIEKSLEKLPEKTN